MIRRYLSFLKGGELSVILKRIPVVVPESILENFVTHISIIIKQLTHVFHYSTAFCVVLTIRTFEQR